jgi:hypothetical protein
MKRRSLLGSLGLTALLSPLVAERTFAAGPSKDNCTLKKGEIQHMVIFNLKHEIGSEKALKFIQDGTRILTGIPVVQNFQALDQVSKKNKYTYGFSMIFASQEDYMTYNNHPSHVAFVQERWLKEVSDFLEIDFLTR